MLKVKLIQQCVARQTVIEMYATYDCTKKDRVPPDLESWDWSSADAIDAHLRGAGLKCGVLAAYLRWNKVGLTLDDLRDCAVVASIREFEGALSRRLGNIERAGCLVHWKPDRDTEWWARIRNGQILSETEPLLSIRPCQHKAVRSEQGKGEVCLQSGTSSSVRRPDRISCFDSSTGSRRNDCQIGNHSTELRDWQPNHCGPAGTE